MMTEIQTEAWVSLWRPSADPLMLVPRLIARAGVLTLQCTGGAVRPPRQPIHKGTRP